MRDSGLTQDAAALAIGSSQSLVSKLVTGDRQPGLHIAHAIERATSTWERGAIRTEEWDEAPHAPTVSDSVSMRECES